MTLENQESSWGAAAGTGRGACGAAAVWLTFAGAFGTTGAVTVGADGAVVGAEATVTGGAGVVADVVAAGVAGSGEVSP